MGNHSETGELLEEALAMPITELRGTSSVVSLVDENGSTIVLDNPTRLKDSSGRDVDFIIPTPMEELGVTLEEAKAILAKQKKKAQ